MVLKGLKITVGQLKENDPLAIGLQTSVQSLKRGEEPGVYKFKDVNFEEYTSK